MPTPAELADELRRLHATVTKIVTRLCEFYTHTTTEKDFPARMRMKDEAIGQITTVLRAALDAATTAEAENLHMKIALASAREGWPGAKPRLTGG